MDEKLTSYNHKGGRIPAVHTFFPAKDLKENDLIPRTLSRQQAILAKKAAAYLSDNVEGQITVSGLSEKFHVSQTYLQNAFKGVYGVPVRSYARILKMRFAALRLIRTDLTVLEIANECGYDNASKFASAFRKVMGELPAEYRRLHGGSVCCLEGEM